MKQRTQGGQRLGESAQAGATSRPEPTVEYVGVRETDDEWHLECRMSDGQKGALVTVDIAFEGLAHEIADYLNRTAEERRAAKSAPPRVLTGAELRYAAENRLPVRYVQSPYDPNELGFDDVVVMEPAQFGYYIGPGDIDPEDFEPADVIRFDLDTCWIAVYAAPGVTYTRQTP